ncbi:MAG: hypothetical protein R3A79_14050 [Nannocystaceae bacterium]
MRDAGQRESPTRAASRGRAGSWFVPAAAVSALFLVAVEARRFLSDDAFISFRYARNLVDGLGLVWNPGEAVEGYTNFLWVLIVAGGMALGAAPERLTLQLGLVAGALILLLLARLDAARFGPDDPRTFAVALVLAVHPSFTGWCSSGLETQFFALLALAGLLQCAREDEAREPWPWRSSAVLAAATLTRPDGAVFMVSAGLVVLAAVARRRRSLRSALLWALPFVAAVGGHMLWRLRYYGYPLPNTFYAKVTGFSWERSTAYFDVFLADYSFLWFAPLAVVGLACRRSTRAALFAISSALYLAYVFYVGGDFLEFRFLVPVYAGVYWLVVHGIHGVAELVDRRAGARGLGGGVAFVLYAALLSATASATATDLQDSRGGGETITATRRYAIQRAEQGRLLRRWLASGLLPSDLRIETGAAGALPYYAGVYTFDLRGLNDVEVAHGPVNDLHRVGHDREATLRMTQARQIDAVLLGHVIIVEGAPRIRREARRQARQWLRHYNAEADDPALELRLRCLQLDDATIMVFGSNLPPARYAARFGHLPTCPGA